MATMVARSCGETAAKHAATATALRTVTETVRERSLRTNNSLFAMISFAGLSCRKLTAEYDVYSCGFFI
jgi:hypothetical protein